MSASAESSPPREGLGRHLAIAFALAVIFYIASFWWIEHRRVVKGPWEIDFLSDSVGSPSLQISETKLQISEKLSFPDDRVAVTNLSQKIIFTEPTTNLPFGSMLLQDALFLPGTVTMQICGHEVAVLPRTLIVDKTEHPWQTGASLVIPKAAVAK